MYSIVGWLYMAVFHISFCRKFLGSCLVRSFDILFLMDEQTCPHFRRIHYLFSKDFAVFE